MSHKRDLSNLPGRNKAESIKSGRLKSHGARGFNKHKEQRLKIRVRSVKRGVASIENIPRVM